MNIKEKKQLQEAIIKLISKTVKKYINESLDNYNLELQIINSGEDYIDLEDVYLTVTFNYEEPDEAGRIVDDYDITATVISAYINSYGIELNCESEDNDYTIMLDDILSDEEVTNVLNAIIEKL